MATNEIELILKQTDKLSADEILILVQKLTASLRRKIKPNEISKTEKGLIYGEFYNQKAMSTEEDFKLAEYHFNEDDWK